MELSEDDILKKQLSVLIVSVLLKRNELTADSVFRCLDYFSLLSVVSGEEREKLLFLVRFYGEEKIQQALCDLFIDFTKAYAGVES